MGKYLGHEFKWLFLYNSTTSVGPHVCLCLISQFDSFLDEHIIAHGNPGRGRISYLSSTICDEFIDLLAKQVLNSRLSIRLAIK